MRTIRLTVAYEGTNYAGWQVQPDQPSIQGALERAISALTGEAVRVHGAGRTDAGVHAAGQVAHFKTASSIPPDRFAPALNSVLPADIVVRDALECSDDFHARYSAVRKQYRYFIDTSPTVLPWRRNLVWRLPERLDLDAMREGGDRLIGRFDFSSFESKSSPEEDSTRTIFELRVEPVVGDIVGFTFAGTEPAVIGIAITADGFLYNMVRSIVGTLVQVGRGKWCADDVTRILIACDRSQAGPTAPPQGLFLVRVDYDDDVQRNLPRKEAVQ